MGETCRSASHGFYCEKFVSNYALVRFHSGPLLLRTVKCMTFMRSKKKKHTYLNYYVFQMEWTIDEYAYWKQLMYRPLKSGRILRCVYAVFSCDFPLVYPKTINTEVAFVKRAKKMQSQSLRQRNVAFENFQINENHATYHSNTALGCLFNWIGFLALWLVIEKWTSIGIESQWIRTSLDVKQWAARQQSEYVIFEIYIDSIHLKIIQCALVPFCRLSIFHTHKQLNCNILNDWHVGHSAVFFPGSDFHWFFFFSYFTFQSSFTRQSIYLIFVLNSGNFLEFSIYSQFPSCSSLWFFCFFF